MEDSRRDPAATMSYLDRWRDTTSTWGEQHPQRALLTSQFIAGGQSVLDIGAGTMVLKRFLHKGCRYQPCDLFARSPECLVADLNKKEFPQGRYDWVVMLGVLQYIYDPAWAVEQCLKVANRAAIAYTPIFPFEHVSNSLEWRKAHDWVNHYDVNNFIALVETAGWHVHRKIYVTSNLLLICDAKQ